MNPSPQAVEAAGFIGEGGKPVLGNFMKDMRRPVFACQSQKGADEEVSHAHTVRNQ
jgi:hypothetical protein